MGEVYKARDTRLDRIVAIKVLPAQLSSDPQFRDRFDREARAISALDHPHICALYDVGEQDGTSFLVMQYPRRGHAAGPFHERGAPPRTGPSVRDSDRGRIGRGAPRRHRPSRFEAWQRHVDQERGEVARLRARQSQCSGGRGSEPVDVTDDAAEPDRPGHDPRHVPGTWRPSSSKARRRTRGRTSSRSARSSTKCSRARRRSRGRVKRV